MPALATALRSQVDTRSFQPLAYGSRQPERLAFQTGTSSQVTEALMRERLRATSNSVFVFFDPRSVEIFGPSPTQNLARIRDGLKTTVLELANLFGVSRQTIYAWQSGTQPSQSALDRLERLASVADILAQAGIPIPRGALRRKVIGGQTLLDAIAEEKDASELARRLAGTLKREYAEQQHLAAHLKGRKAAAASTAEGDYGAPHVSNE